jgi:AcrR family transcriptional regulator
VRTRPTRDETREKLFEAAAEVFEEHGIGAASIEMIAAAAGLTRGAFYSNFDGKDDLIIAMLEDHVERSLKHHRELLARHRDPADFVAALRTAERSRHDPLPRRRRLHMEEVCSPPLRSNAAGPKLAKRLQARAPRPGRGESLPEWTSPTVPGRAPWCSPWRTASAFTA